MSEISKSSGLRGRTKCQHKHQNIVSAAVDAFLSAGYNGSSMDSIAEAAGVSKQTLYSHFGGKEGLFKVAIQTCCEEQNLNADLFQREADCEQILRDFAFAFSALVTSDDVISSMRTVIAEAEQYPDVAQMFYSAGPQVIKNLLADYLQSQVDAKVLIIDDIQFAICHLVGMCKGELEFRCLLNLDKTEFQAKNAAYLDATIKAFMKAYRA